MECRYNEDVECFTPDAPCEHCNTYIEKCEDDQKVLRAQLYLRVFGTSDGKEVLYDILNDLHFYSTDISNDEERILHNAAAKIFEKAGVFVAENVRNLTDALIETSVENRRR